MGIVLITGCGSGFGRLAALEAARRGHTVYAGLRVMSSAEDLMASADGLDVTPLPLDVTSPEQRRAAVDRIEQRHGHIDGLVNNAGIALGGFLEDVDEEELRQLFDVNVFGAWALTKRCLPLLRGSTRATVVMVSSMSAVMALPGLGAYASSKFALEGMSEAWRHELAPFGIRVVLLQPAAYRTDIFGRNRRVSANAHDEASPYAAWSRSLDELATKRAHQMARDPQQVADRICDVLATRNPRLRHPMGAASLSRTILKRLAPFDVVQRIIRLIAPRPPV